MTRFSIALPATLALVLSACGDTREAESAEDFAARVNGQQTAAAANPATDDQAQQTEARVAEQPEGAAPGPIEPGTATDPQSASCGAPAAAGFMGRALDDTTSKLIADAVPEGTRIRVLKPGSTLVANPGSDRLNVMIDNAGIIRDLRCG